MLSALIISPFNFFANCMAYLDLPEALGPSNKIIFFDKINLFLHQGNVFGYFDL